MITRAMGREIETYDSSPPERFVVEVFSELPAAVVQERWKDVNAILRLSMLSGLPMELEATLNLLCDLAGEMISYDRALLYFWDDSSEHIQLCATRNLEGALREKTASGNILNLWATKCARPLLVSVGHNVQADDLLRLMQCSSALAIPLLVSNRVMGTMQFFAERPNAFSPSDAQLLWILSLVAENQLTREHSTDGLIRFAFTDFLTGLKTRGYFEQQLETEMKRSARKKENLALLMVDIDFFKQLNDRYGHHAGDQILRDVASLLIKDMREVDTVARYGGEEFVIILPETNHAGAKFVAQRLRRTVEQARFFAGSSESVEHLTISIGVAIFDNDAQFKRDLIERSDAALYAAKKSGRNKVILYSELASEQRGVS